MTRTRSVSNPTPGLVLILAAIGAWLILYCAWAVLNAVALAVIGGEL